MEDETQIYDRIKQNLRRAYDRRADDRAALPPLPAWKLSERHRFLTWLQAEDKTNLLEIGAGTGRDALFFQNQGLAVTAVDLAPEHIRHCRALGLKAHVMDFVALDFPDGAFSAVYGMNCLLHVPKPALPAILTEISRVLAPGGLFYWGQYGGYDFAGIWPGDAYEPKRFFAFYTDDALRTLAAQFFRPLAFTVIHLPEWSKDQPYFQSQFLQKAA